MLKNTFTCRGYISSFPVDADSFVCKFSKQRELICSQKTAHEDSKKDKSRVAYGNLAGVRVNTGHCCCCKYRALSALKARPHHLADLACTPAAGHGGRGATAVNLLLWGPAGLTGPERSVGELTDNGLFFAAVLLYGCVGVGLAFLVKELGGTVLQVRYTHRARTHACMHPTPPPNTHTHTHARTHACMHTRPLYTSIFPDFYTEYTSLACIRFGNFGSLY